MSDQSAAVDAKDPWDSPILTRHKTFPERTHRDYLSLVDLNEFIKARSSRDALTILDYGAGSSPYRKYFPNADYRRADITGASSLRYQINADSTISESDETFDLILSTQVAEHVPNPDVYFKEAFRLLKPGGQFILTTHGIWDEHGSPYDFQRWTAGGLRRDLMHAGFKQLTTYKLTCGLRAAAVILTRSLFDAPAPDDLLRRVFFKSFRWIYSRLFPSVYQICESWWPQDGIVPEREGDAGPNWYLVIAAIARK